MSLCYPTIYRDYMFFTENVTTATLNSHIWIWGTFFISLITCFCTVLTVWIFNVCFLLILSLFFYIVLTCRLNSMSQPLVKCKRVFQALIKLAVEELCETADSLIAPVRLGVARPTAPFTLASSTIDVINVSKSVTLCLLLWNFCYL